MKNKESINFLIVDDFMPMPTALRNNLISLGYEKIAITTKGEEAINYIENQPWTSLFLH